MHFYVYIFYSVTTGKYYVGRCEDIQIRLLQHNTGRNISTRSGKPWIIKKIEEYQSLSEARTREGYIKKMKAGSLQKWLLTANGKLCFNI